MYFPYFRGKQYELVLLRDIASNLARWNFTPVLEPVRDTLAPLQRTITSLMESDCEFVIIANPSVGAFKNSPHRLYKEILPDLLGGYDKHHIGFIVNDEKHTVETIRLSGYQEASIALIHNKQSDAKRLLNELERKKIEPNINIFNIKSTSKLYRRNFPKKSSVTIEDCFVSRNNREYPPAEHFSDLYLTYEEEHAAAFGDFLTVSGEFTEGGGPAYAVAIHLTYQNTESDNSIFIKHYVSDETGTPTNPAGKFLEALKKLVADVNHPRTLIHRTSAVEEFLKLYENGHFPGLGYVKKLSMQHHLELYAKILSGG